MLFWEESTSVAWFRCDTFLSQTKRPIKRFNASIFEGLVIKYFYTVIETVFCTVICHIPLHLPWFIYVYSPGREREREKSNQRRSNWDCLPNGTFTGSFTLWISICICKTQLPCWEMQTVKQDWKVKRIDPVSHSIDSIEFLKLEIIINRTLFLLVWNPMKEMMEAVILGIIWRVCEVFIFGLWMGPSRDFNFEPACSIWRYF